MSWYTKARVLAVKPTAFERMAAAGMSQLLRHMMSGPFAIISAERADMTPEERDLARRNLKYRLQQMELGYVDTAGAWRESGVYSRESSVFVSGITVEQAEALGREFGQESVIVGDRGKYGFLKTEGDPAAKPPSLDHDLSHTLDIDLLRADPMPELFTEIGNKRFVLRTDPHKPKVPNPQRPDITFTPEEIRERRERYERLVPKAKCGPVVTAAFVAHQYDGSPCSQMAKYAIRGLGAPCPGAGGMIYCIPFAATFVEHLTFDPSPHWGPQGSTRTASKNPVPDMPASDVYEEALGGLAKFRGGVNDLFSRHKPGQQNLAGFDSLYLGTSGDFFLLPPHRHDDMARSVLRSVHPDLPAVKRDGGAARGAGGYTHTDLTRASGIQRIQIYRDGMGVTIDMENPPNHIQLSAIADAYMMTPMQTFVAEITMGGKLLAHLTKFDQLRAFVRNFDPSSPETTRIMDPAFAKM